jgi:hypothetical protein
VVAFCSSPHSYFPSLDSCGCPISRCAIFALMFRAARVNVSLILGFLFLNLVCGYALDYPCISSYVGVLAVGHPIDLRYLWLHM